MVLDLSNPEVQDFVFGVVDRLMTQYPELAYIKWDANMTLANYGSSYLSKEKQSHLYIDYHRGFRKIVERIRLKYPDLVMQACASGGGRANYGVLAGFDGELLISSRQLLWHRMSVLLLIIRPAEECL